MCELFHLFPSNHAWMNCYYCHWICQDEAYCDYTAQHRIEFEGELIFTIPEPKTKICEHWRLRGRGILPDIPFQPICSECKQSVWFVKLDRNQISLECECGKLQKIDINNWR